MAGYVKIGGVWKPSTDYYIKENETNSTLKSNSGYLPNSLANATITIGSYGVEHSHDAVNVEVLEFSVTKL